MDEQFELNGVSFIWNQAKAEDNVRKHGIAFTQAAEVFFDPFLRVVDARSDDEVRDAMIGMDERWNLCRAHRLRTRFGSAHICS